MLPMKLTQLLHESDSWKRSLGFLADENIQLKDRLAQVIKYNFNKTLLEDLENFQTKFIQEDELIKLLRHDLVELDKLLIREKFEDGEIMYEINNKSGRLRNQIHHMEKQFGKLKFDFNDYILKHIVHE